MSEYTQYFVVKSASEVEVQGALEVARIKSIVDADEGDYWFSPEHKRGGRYRWVTVSAPADSRFENGTFVYRNQFDSLCDVFETVVLFFQEENGRDWRLDLKTPEAAVSKLFYKDQPIEFDPVEQALLVSVFGKTFQELQPLLQVGKAAEFLNVVGIPYVEMNDQDLIGARLFSEKYSLLSREIED